MQVMIYLNFNLLFPQLVSVACQDLLTYSVMEVECVRVFPMLLVTSVISVPPTPSTSLLELVVRHVTVM